MTITPFVNLIFRTSDGVTMKTKAINKWLHQVTLKLPASEKQIFKRKKKSFLYRKYFSFLLIYLQLRSSLFYTQITLSSTGKFMLTITRLEWLVTTHLIFDRNIREKKWKSESNSTYLNYFKKCCIQSCFSTTWTVWTTKKDLCIFYGKNK